MNIFFHWNKKQQQKKERKKVAEEKIVLHALDDWGGSL